MLRYEKIWLSLKIKIGGKKNSAGHKTLNVAKKIILLVGVDYLIKKLLFEFNLKSVFLSDFFKKRFYFADFPEVSNSDGINSDSSNSDGSNSDSSNNDSSNSCRSISDSSNSDSSESSNGGSSNSEIFK